MKGILSKDYSVKRHSVENDSVKKGSVKNRFGKDGLRGNHFHKGIGCRIAAAAVFLLVYVAAIYFANRGFSGYTITEDSGIEYETAKVQAVLEDNSYVDEDSENIRTGSMELRLIILTGRYKGDVVDVTNNFSALYNVYVTKGDTVTVRIDTSGVDEYQVSIYNYNRTPILIAFVLIFAVALAAIGGSQGICAFLGLAFTFVSIIFLLLPLSLKGFDPIPVTLIVVGITTLVCFYLLGGWQPKTVAAATGSICGILCAAVLGALASNLVHITTYQTDEAEALMLAAADSNLHMKGLFLCGILIAAEGAVMDIAMSVSSALEELSVKKPGITSRELFLSGLKIGRDVTGTMANTLVLAVAGSSLNMMVLIYSYQVSFTQLMNTDFVAVELIRGIAGSLGVILTVPCAAAAAAVLLNPRSAKLRK